ncbi:MAG: PorP/SprF family type IX secretion system membrane protein [Cyclobacteriaceae bacterium]
MARFSLYIFFILAFWVSEAQNNLFFSHHMFSPSYYNPAWVGVESVSSVSFLYRNQWTGYNTSFDGAGGAPNTQMLSFVVPVKDLPIKGVGLNVSNDNLGPENNIQLQLSAAYELKLRFGSLYLGVMPGVFTKTINGNKLDPNDPIDPKLQSFLGSRETQTKFNMGFGLLYQSDKGHYIGVSSINLVEPSFDFGVDGLSNSQKRSYVIHGGKPFVINKKITLRPNVILRTNLTGFTFDLGSILNYKDKMWTGLSYRLEESLIAYFGYSLMNNKLKAGYSFDLVVHNPDAKQPTSNEIFLRYNLPDFVFGGRKSVKTPRFTF